VLDRIDWEESAVLCHNALFDCAILSWHYGIRPAFIFDTLCMARAIHGVDAGGSLAALAQRYSLGTKGTEVVNAFGKGLYAFTPEELATYGEYCKNDVELTYKLFHKLMEGHKA
jgi:DNA polymerase